MKTSNPNKQTLDSILHHPFKPILYPDSKILILGSFPSVISRKQNFYYANPRNRFWQILEILFCCSLTSKNPDEKEIFLKKYKIALFDICLECKIVNSSDSSLKLITNVPLESLLQNTQIRHIFLNGKKAAQIYERVFKDSTLLRLPHTTLPSTSPANAKWNLEKLCQEWSKILLPLQN